MSQMANNVIQGSGKGADVGNNIVPGGTGAAVGAGIGALGGIWAGYQADEEEEARLAREAEQEAYRRKRQEEADMRNRFAELFAKSRNDQAYYEGRFVPGTSSSIPQ